MRMVEGKMEKIDETCVPFVVEVAPGLPAGRALEDDATQGPDV